MNDPLSDDGRPRGLESGERNVLKHLVAAWNAFIALPSLHPDDQTEFRHSIHSAQLMIMARPMQDRFNRLAAGEPIHSEALSKEAEDELHQAEAEAAAPSPEESEVEEARRMIQRVRALGISRAVIFRDSTLGVVLHIFRLGNVATFAALAPEEHVPTRWMWVLSQINGARKNPKRQAESEWSKALLAANPTLALLDEQEVAP